MFKDYYYKIASVDSRPQVGVRIDPQEIDEETGMSIGYGKQDYYNAICYLRENTNKEGSLTINGKPASVLIQDKAWWLEHLLWPFDEASLNYKDFDCSIIYTGQKEPEPELELLAPSCRMAIASAISKMFPVRRIPLKKAGLLTLDRRKEIGEHVGFLDKKIKRRKFRKR